ncbi:MAG: hypothetical protein U1F60_14355 [Planctomycetota bacterium]
MKAVPGLRRGNWSVAELERLRQLLPRRGVAAMAALLHRSPASVQRKAAELLRVPARRGDWTASDEQLLREAWGALDLRLLAIALGRPVADVRRRADALRRDRRDGPWTRDEEALLKALYGTRVDQDLEVSLSRPAAAIADKALQLCLAKDKRFRASPRPSVVEHAEPGRGRRMPRWTPQEVERLRRLYPERGNLDVARELGRTVTSVANKAHQLGLHKDAELLSRIGRANVGWRYGQVGADDAQSAPTESA